MRARVVGIGLILLTLTGCQGWQSALDTHGPEAKTLEHLFWTFTAILGAVWTATMVAFLFSLRQRRSPGEDPLSVHSGTDRRMTIVVSCAVALTAIIVLSLTALSYGGQRALFSHKDGVVSMTIVGHQWWWEIRYEDQQPSRTFTTANEFHVPVGEPVLIKLESTDVIHSFWVPSLAGKLDLIPGRQNQIEIQADRPGIYRGQCAEFCGNQHAHMGMLVVAESREDFDRWREQQIAAARPPSDPDSRRGHDIFLTKPCLMCHAIRGTSAGGRVAPDLTHVGSRRMIAAGALETTRGNLAAWIVDPQGIKPGVHMPVIKLEPDEIQPLATYLEGLK
jgi:cytochrome c oxidase subunit II